nr:MAG TPA: hypothetical protein [Caudoviricetes sp.]
MQTINFYNLQHEILPGMLYPQYKKRLWRNYIQFYI